MCPPTEQKIRHASLTAAGWIYDPAQDRYLEPGGDPKAGTWRNEGAAWLRHLHLQQQAQPIDKTPDDPRRAHAGRDPRRSRPQ